MSKMTFQFRMTFDTTFIVDKESATKAVGDMVAVYQDAEKFKLMPAKQKAITGLVAQAFLTHGLDAGVAELMRYNFRVGMTELLRSDVANAGDEGSIRVSPVKVEHLV